VRGQQSDPHGAIDHHPSDAFAADSLDPEERAAEGRDMEYRDQASDIEND
jgi:hypothetical protein